MSVERDGIRCTVGHAGACTVHGPGVLAAAVLELRAAGAAPPAPPAPPDEATGNGNDGEDAETPRPLPGTLRIEIAPTHYGRWRATVRSGEGDLVAGTSHRDRAKVIEFVIGCLTGGGVAR